MIVGALSIARKTVVQRRTRYGTRPQSIPSHSSVQPDLDQYIFVSSCFSWSTFLVRGFDKARERITLGYYPTYPVEVYRVLVVHPGSVAFIRASWALPTTCSMSRWKSPAIASIRQLAEQLQELSAFGTAPAHQRDDALQAGRSLQTPPPAPSPRPSSRPSGSGGHGSSRRRAHDHYKGLTRQSQRSASSMRGSPI